MKFTKIIKFHTILKNQDNFATKILNFVVLTIKNRKL